MAIDIGPFQDLVGYDFGGTDTPEAFIDGEDVSYRTDCDDPGTAQPGGQVSRQPSTGTITRLCGCTDSAFSGAYDCYQLVFSVPNSYDWPDCVVSDTSGAKLDNAWPDEPDGWGTSPKAFATPAGFCAIPQWTIGTPGPSSFQILMVYCANCGPGIGAPDDCCG